MARVQDAGDIERVPAGVTRAPGIRINADDFGADLFRAFADAGDQAARLALDRRDKLLAQQENLAVAEAKRSVRQESQDAFLSAQETIDPADPQFGQTLGEQYGRIVESALANAQSRFRLSADAVARIRSSAEDAQAPFFRAVTTAAHNGRVARAESDFESALSAFEISVERDGGTIDQARRSAVETLDSLRGALPPDKERDLRADIDRRLFFAAVRGEAKADPTGTLAAIAAGEFDDTGLEIEDIRKLEAFATTQRNQRLGIADKLDRLAERRLKRQQEDNAFSLFERLGAEENPLTQEEVDAAAERRDIDKDDFKALRSALVDEGEGDDDPIAVVDLETRVDDEDVKSDATRYFLAKRLTMTTYRSILSKNRTARGDDQPDSPFKTSRARINQALNPGQLLSGPAATVARRAQASALVEFDLFAEQNPDTNRTDMLQEADRIINAFQTVQVDRLRIALGLPRFFRGTRAEISVADLDSAESDALEAFDTGDLSRAQLDEELRKIEDWRRILSGSIQRQRTAPQSGRPNAARPQ